MMMKHAQVSFLDNLVELPLYSVKIIYNVLAVY